MLRRDHAVQGMQLILFQRDDCQLCDQALAVLAAARVPDFASRWIDDDEALEALYGTRVPVLREDTGGSRTRMAVRCARADALPGVRWRVTGHSSADPRGLGFSRGTIAASAVDT